MPSKVLQYRTPLKCLKKNFPDARINLELPLQIFGCTAYVHIHKGSRLKLDPGTEKCIFTGYTPNQKDVEKENQEPQSAEFGSAFALSEKEILRLIKKIEKILSHWFIHGGNFLDKGEKLVEQNFREIIEPLPAVILDVEKENQEPQSAEFGSAFALSEKEILRLIKKIEKILSHWFIHGVNFLDKGEKLVEQNFREIIEPLPAVILDVEKENQEPQYAEFGSAFALNYRAFTTKISELAIPRNIQEALDEPNWKLAMFEEMNALKKMILGRLLNYQKEKKVVGFKWVFTIKSEADGSVERYKARLFAKSKFQLAFTPIGCKKNVFLNGDLEDEVFMSSPPDDIVITGNDCYELEKLKGKLAKEFEIKDLGALKYILGMEFARSSEGIFVNQ
ncbi:uncharacterized protein [Henckelia pumila]|uniref:uncharacterized protein n=1 Tax=Henckelia pumila TaxID=405737 RepID=UPI003C6DF9C9